MAVDQSIIGETTDKTRVRLERTPLSQFAAACTDDNPVYQDAAAAEAAGFDAIPAAPTAPFAWSSFGAFPEIQPEDKPTDNPMFKVMGDLRAKGGLILHGEQEFVYHRTPVAGDNLVGEGKIVEAYEKASGDKTMTFIVTETTWRDAGTDEPVVTARFNLLHRV